MSTRSTGRRRRKWVAIEGAASAHRLVQLGLWPPLLADTQPESVNVRLNESSRGEDFSGTPSAAAGLIGTDSLNEFGSAELTAEYQLEGGSIASTLTVHLDLSLRLVTVNLKNSPAEPADEAFRQLEEVFPRTPPLTSVEEELQAARAAKVSIETMRDDGQAALTVLKSYVTEKDALLNGIDDELAKATAAATDAGTKVQLALDQLAEITARRDEANATHATVEESRQAVEQARLKAAELLEGTQASLTAAKESQAQAGTASEEARARRDELNQQLAEAKTAAAEVAAHRKATQEGANNVNALEAKVRAFHDEIGANQTKLAEIERNAVESVDSYSTATERAIAESVQLQQQIRDQLHWATGGALFSAFNQRQAQINISKWIWGAFSIGAFVAQAAAVIWLAHEARVVPGPDNGAFYSQPMFILKATVTIPLFGLIWFCVRQYSNERDHEETYAFKATLSVSLSPYLDLVQTLSAKERTTEEAQFAIKTIGQIFNQPGPPHSAPRVSARQTRRDGMLAKDIAEKIIETLANKVP